MGTGKHYLNSKYLLAVHQLAKLSKVMIALEVVPFQLINAQRCAEMVWLSRDLAFNIVMMEILIQMMDVILSVKSNSDFSVAAEAILRLIYVLKFVEMESGLAIISVMMEILFLMMGKLLSV